MDKQKKKKSSRKALGRGLSSLISTPAVSLPTSSAAENLRQPVPAEPLPAKIVEYPSSSPLSSDSARLDPEVERHQVLFVDIDSVSNNPRQPRKSFKSAELQELADSIKAKGVLQPILVRPSALTGSIKYEIVAGERRWRASRVANVGQIPVIVKDLDDQQTLEVALIENVQRSDLNPIEEAEGYQVLADKFNLSQQQIAEKVGKDRSSVTNSMRLLKLPAEVRQLVAEKQLSTGHAKVILAVKEPSVQRSLAKKVLTESLSVRKLEEIVSRVIVLDNSNKKKKFLGNKAFPEVSDRLRKVLGTKVVVKHQTTGRGKLEISYFSEDELDRIVEIISD